jgi:hypothetical protein
MIVGFEVAAPAVMSMLATGQRQRGGRRLKTFRCKMFDIGLSSNRHRSSNEL